MERCLLAFRAHTLDSETSIPFGLEVDMMSRSEVTEEQLSDCCPQRDGGDVIT